MSLEKQEQEIYNELEEKYDFTEIGHVVRDVIKLSLNKAKKQESKYQRWTDEEEKKVVEMYELGYPYSEIAKDLKRPESSIYQRVQWFIQQGILDDNAKKKRDWGAGHGEEVFTKSEVDKMIKQKCREAHKEVVKE